jgi:hypothetical protein
VLYAIGERSKCDGVEVSNGLPLGTAVGDRRGYGNASDKTEVDLVSLIARHLTAISWRSAVLDAELVLPNSRGIPDFAGLPAALRSSRQHETRGLRLRYPAPRWQRSSTFAIKRAPATARTAAGSVCRPVLAPGRTL